MVLGRRETKLGHRTWLEDSISTYWTWSRSNPVSRDRFNAFNRRVPANVELSSHESNLGEPYSPSIAGKLPQNAVGGLCLSFRQTAFVIPSSDESRVSKARASRRDGAYKSNIREFHLNVTAALFRSIGELSRRRWGPTESSNSGVFIRSLRRGQRRTVSFLSNWEVRSSRDDSFASSSCSSVFELAIYNYDESIDCGYSCEIALLGECDRRDAGWAKRFFSPTFFVF